MNSLPPSLYSCIWAFLTNEDISAWRLASRVARASISWHVCMRHRKLVLYMYSQNPFVVARHVKLRSSWPEYYRTPPPLRLPAGITCLDALDLNSMFDVILDNSALHLTVQHLLISDKIFSWQDPVLDTRRLSEWTALTCLTLTCMICIPFVHVGFINLVHLHCNSKVPFDLNVLPNLRCFQGCCRGPTDKSNITTFAPTVITTLAPNVLPLLCPPRVTTLVLRSLWFKREKNPSPYAPFLETVPRALTELHISGLWVQELEMNRTMPYTRFPCFPHLKRCTMPFDMWEASPSFAPVLESLRLLYPFYKSDRRVDNLPHLRELEAKCCTLSLFHVPNLRHLFVAPDTVVCCSNPSYNIYYGNLESKWCPEIIL